MPWGAFRVFAILLPCLAYTRFCVLGTISRVRNGTSLLTKHAVSGQGRSFACKQCCRRGLHARETIPGLAFRVYVMLRLFFTYMRFYTYTDISRARNSLSLFCMHAVLCPESLFACLQYILAASGAREHVSKPRFRVYAKPNHRRQIKTTYIICPKKSTYYKNLRKKTKKRDFLIEKIKIQQNHARNSSQSGSDRHYPTTNHLHNEPWHAWPGTGQSSHIRHRSYH